jgi:ribosome biogenesis protein ENP2
MSAATAFPKVYTVNGPSSTSASSLPSWITTKARPTKSAHSNHKKRTKTQHSLGELELIQDFAFPASAIRIKTTEDGQHAIGTGAYKPMMKVWDLEQLTVKFERVTDAENVDFVVGIISTFQAETRSYGQSDAIWR